jgi:hypothetical protein
LPPPSPLPRSIIVTMMGGGGTRESARQPRATKSASA